MFENLLSGPGLILLLCVGAILLVGVSLYGLRSLFTGRRREDSRYTQREDDLRRTDYPQRTQIPGTGPTPGARRSGAEQFPGSRPQPRRGGAAPRSDERPRYDSGDVRSSGGFGKSKSRSDDDNSPRGGFGS